MKVAVTMPKLSVTKKGVEKKKEVYVLSLASDLTKIKDRPPALGASNATLETIAPGVASSLPYVVAACSNTFKNVTAKDPVPLLGSGLVLYPPEDPKGMLALHVAVIESDKGQRKIFEAIAKDDNVKAGIKELAKAVAPSSALITNLFAAMTSVIGDLLTDDVLLQADFSGFDWDNYGVDGKVTTFPLSSDYAEAQLCLRTVGEA